jgi:hypothetical protein
MPNSAAQNPVYGNNLAQQITSTFDVALCGLALCILAAAILTARRLRRPKRRAARKRPGAAAAQPTAATTRITAGAQPPSAAATTRIPTGPATQSPRIFRGDDSGTRQIRVPKPKIYRPPQDSQ